ncbi:SLATT domain-containing protein [Vibrio harveyi]|uniref:SLATT domain-containing protein n=1 Tax=Vibrio harveyi TaxID=669 RepID=UPI002A023051|nr:SLATT domain-containing protein [Vibrio harveyi]
MSDCEQFQNIREEFERHLIDSEQSKKAHFDLCDYYVNRSRFVEKLQYFGTACIMAWLLSTQFKGLLPDDSHLITIVPIILSLVVAVLSILDPVLKYKEFAYLHEKSAKRYHTLWRACKNWETDFPTSGDVKEAKVAVQQYREQLNDLNRESPHLSGASWKIINKVRSKSAYNNDISKYPSELKK